MSMLLSFSDRFEMALGFWPFASMLLTLPILAFLYHRHGRLTMWGVCGAYLAVLYALGLVCFTLYPLPAGASGPGITYGIPPQLNLLAFVGDIRSDGMRAVFQIAANVVFFVPLGFIAGRAFGLRLVPAAIFGFAVSLLVETAQLTGLFGIYPYAYRTFDVDDLVWNTSGAVIGWCAAAGVNRLLPSGAKGEIEPTRTPGFVRRSVALALDGLLIGTVTLIIGAAAVLVRRALGAAGSEPADNLLWLAGAVALVVEGVIPWMRAGRTPGGGFVRMTMETKERTGARRVLFYAARLGTLALVFWYLPVAVPCALLFYLICRRMPYDYL